MRVAACLTACAALAAVALGPRAAEAKCTNVPTTDNVTLSTCVWWDKDSEPKTSIVDRSPYGHLALELLAVAFGLLEKRVGIAQDQRGTGFSTGEFAVWGDAAADAYNTLGWAAAQPWSDGNFYDVGASADGIAALFQANKPSPNLRGQMAVFAGTNGFDIIYPGGAFRKELATKWLEGTVPKQAAGLLVQLREHETPVGEYWATRNVSEAKFAEIDYPLVTWMGAYDIFNQANVDFFNTYRKNARADLASRARLVMDPLGHCQKAAKYFPKHLIAGRAILPLLQAWELFKNETVKAEGAKAVTAYVMGATAASGAPASAPGNYWTTLDDWPEAAATPYYLGAGGKLSTDAPSSAGNSTYAYDPADPVPTLGGNNLELPCGPALVNSNEKRGDVLTFSTEPLAEATYIMGRVTATFYVSSNATDTDFTAMLTDVYPNGDSRLLVDGIRRMRWRECTPESCSLSPMQRGTVYEATLDLWTTAFAFAPGHRIRLDVSSSNYPRFSANRNVAQTLMDNSTAPVVAENTVWYTPDHPSHVTLPVVTAAQIPPAFVVLDDEGNDTGRVRFSNRPDYDEFVERAEHLEKYIQLATSFPRRRL